jgi:hypothetical protein
LPLVGSVPLQPPEAEQELALVEDQVSVDVPPPATAVGSAANVAVGGLMATVAVAGVLLPPGPEHVMEKVEPAVNPAVLCDPLVPSAPLQSPEAVQDLALDDDQVNVTELPRSTALCDAASVTAGNGGGAPEPPPHAKSSAAAAPARNIGNMERTTSPLGFRHYMAYGESAACGDSQSR